MLRAFACIASVALLSGAAIGQSVGTQVNPRLSFEIAVVHVSAHSTNPNMRGGLLRGGRYELRTANMVDLIRTAYSIDADKVLGGPSWLESDRFDVIAKTQASTSLDTAKLMLQTLLADRFKLVDNNETKSLPSFALTVGKGKPKLKETDGSGETGCKPTIQGLQAPPGGPDAGGPAAAPTILYTCHNMTMAAFAEGMRSMALAQPGVGNNPVLDQTGLTGSWDFTFKYTIPIRVLPGMAAAPETITFFDALDKQLGLKLDPVKVPVPVIVVDSVNQKPTDNLPGVTSSLPVLPVEFEVADIRPSDPEFKGMRLQIQPGGRVNIGGMTLKFLIQQAWSITDDSIVGAPKWMDTDRFDIVAKAPATGPETGPSSGPAPGSAVDLDSIWLMLRALLAERFKLATHTEDRPTNAYTLVAAKPKLKKADPSNRTGCIEGPQPGEKDPRDANPAISRLITCRNMTMTQFADELQRRAGGYIHNPVLDATGIEGAWDFALSFSAAGIVQGGGGGGRGGEVVQPPNAAPGASDPSGGLSLFDAITKQLGLKLEMQKRSLPVLVIDHVEQKPTDN